jgi:hypothetical protein
MSAFMKLVRKALDVLFRKYNTAHRFRWNLIPTLAVLIVLALSLIFPGLFTDSRVAQNQGLNATRLLSQSESTLCVYDRECSSRSCDQGRCKSLFEMNTWAERRKLLKLISEAQKTTSQIQQKEVDLTLVKALAIHQEAVPNIRPKVLEAMSIHSAPLDSLKLWTEKWSADDPEVFLASFRFHDLASIPLELKVPEDSTQDVLLLFADAHPSVLVGLCREKRLRRAYPSFDARCARITCRSGHPEPTHDAVRALSRFWDCISP